MLKRVLVVDDDDYIRELVSITLDEEGYAVTTASNGAEALKIIDQGLEDLALIVLDVRMPVMDGTTFLKIYRERVAGKTVPIIVISAASDNSKLADQLKADTYLAKPFELDDLSRMVSKYAGMTA